MNGIPLSECTPRFISVHGTYTKMLSSSHKCDMCVYVFVCVCVGVCLCVCGVGGGHWVSFNRAWFHFMISWADMDPVAVEATLILCISHHVSANKFSHARVSSLTRTI